MTLTISALLSLALFSSPAALDEEVVISDAKTDSNGFLVHQVRSPYQEGTTEIRVLLPDKIEKGKRYPVVYLLPVEKGRENRFGDGLLEAKKQDLQNRLQVIFVAPTFSHLPWYADHPDRPGIRQEMYFLKVVLAFIEKTYPVEPGPRGRLLVGFSKSGWGAFSLLLRHPEVFGKAAAWDAPLMMMRPDRFGMEEIFGTQDNFERWQITRLLKDKADHFKKERRLFLIGYGSFRDHHEKAHALMESLNIDHEYRDGPARKHDWHSGWVAEAVRAVLGKEAPDISLSTAPWEPGPITGESVLFIQPKDGQPAAKLLFDVNKVLTVQSADGKKTFEAGKDFELAADGSGLLLPAGSRIPFRKETDLFPPKGAPNSIGQRQGDPASSIYFGEGHFFHDLQIEVSYLPRKEARWTGWKPAFAGKTLPGTLDKLRNKKGLTLAVSGDSISQGYNASGYTKSPPFLPPYPALVAAGLEKTYGTKVTLHNRAIAGWSVGQGVKDLDNLLKTKADLVILAYGMNDVGGRNPKGYKKAIQSMLTRIKEADPATEVILVAAMMGNPEWHHTPPDMFPKYRDALASLQGPGLALADMTAVWQTLMERKRFVDMTGNGVNHPNDYGHRLYAQAILGLLKEPRTE